MTWPEISGAVPKGRFGHEWADYVELLCLGHQDRSISLEDAVDLCMPESDDVAGEETFTEDDVPIETEDGEAASEESSGERQERWINKMGQHFEICKGRSRLFAANYPFEIEDNTIRVKASLDRGNAFYLFLLFCSSLKFVNKAESNQLTSSFEKVAMEVLKGILPAHALVKSFGKGSEASPCYTGNIFNKLECLAADIKCENKIPRTDLASTNTGDEGLDVVGWIPLKDNQDGFPVFFCQCACGKNWISKQSESSYDAWASKLSMKQTMINIVCAPYCFRAANGDWEVRSKINNDVVLIDRLRLSRIVADTFDVNSLNSHPLLSRLLEARYAA